MRTMQRFIPTVTKTLKYQCFTRRKLQNLMSSEALHAKIMIKGALTSDVECFEGYPVVLHRGRFAGMASGAWSCWSLARGAPGVW